MTRHEQDLAFWVSIWKASDASRAYRQRSDEWRADGFPDVADQLDPAADAHDAEQDQRMLTRHQVGY